ncbi:MAG: FAD:protein FMN transferase [bacterium]|nr:FAD:protein FMN transferase [bacterium]
MNRYTVLLLGTLILALGCGKGQDRFPHETRTVFGIPVTVTFFLPDSKPEDVKSGFEVAFSTLSWYEAAGLKPGAENQLEKIAAGAGKESVPTDTLIYSLLMRGLQLNDMTDEAFDLRYGPLLDAWTIGGRVAKPAQAELDSALSLIKTGGMFVAGKSILLSRPKMRFDVRGFLDAWAIDRAAEKLTAKGYSMFEIRTPFASRVVGLPTGQQSYEMKLGNPETADSTWATLAVAPCGVAYFPTTPVRDGLGNFRFVVDPRNGNQSAGGVVAMAKDCATAFALGYALAIRDGERKAVRAARGATWQRADSREQAFVYDCRRRRAQGQAQNAELICLPRAAFW